MHEDLQELVEAEWEAGLGVSRAVLRSGGVHVITGELGGNDAMSFHLGRTCIVVVPPSAVDAAEAAVDGLDAAAAFTAEILRNIVGPDASVDGPSMHSYVDAEMFRGSPDDAAQPVDGGD